MEIDAGDAAVTLAGVALAVAAAAETATADARLAPWLLVACAVLALAARSGAGWGALARISVRRAADSAVPAAIAWHAAVLHEDVLVAAAAVAAMAFGLLASYAVVRARGLGIWTAGTGERVQRAQRYAVLAFALASDSWGAALVVLAGADALRLVSRAARVRRAPVRS